MTSEEELHEEKSHPGNITRLHYRIAAAQRFKVTFCSKEKEKISLTWQVLKMLSIHKSRPKQSESERFSSPFYETCG